MARPKVSVNAQAIPTALRPCTGSVNESAEQKTSPITIVQRLKRTPSTQGPALQVKTEPNRSPALGEKLLPATPIPATIPSRTPGTFLGAEGLQAPAAAIIWPSTRPAKENHGQASPEPTIAEIIQGLERPPRTQRRPAVPVKTKQNRIPASASPSTAAAVKVEGVDLLPSNSSGDSQGVNVSNKREWKVERKASTVGKKPRTGRFTLSLADLVSDSDMRLEDKAKKLGVSRTTFKNRRNDFGLGRWPGRRVRAEIKRGQAQARA